MKLALLLVLGWLAASVPFGMLVGMVIGRSMPPAPVTLRAPVEVPMPRGGSDEPSASGGGGARDVRTPA
ncbi:MAG TPA: hypothetical protein VFR07_08935 [Mycobacteriales bacterium]|nr:hypothetical protein [Mycobacteriales bacterium]